MNTRVTSLSNFHIAAAGCQWIGGREQQEDSYSLHPAEDSNRAQSFLALLADGMGGVADGEKASKHLVDSFLCAYAGKFGGEALTTDTLVHCISYANQSLADCKREGRIDKEAGATFIALGISNEGLNWLNVGDSLLYRQHGTEITKINTAHTWQWELERRVNNGEMTPEEAAAAPGPRHALYSAVCGEDYLEAELVDNTECCVGDRFIISSDGLLPLVKTGWESLLNSPDVRSAAPAEVCELLMNKLRLLHVPNQDNTSIIVVDILPAENYSEHHATVSLIGDRDSQQDNEACWKSDKAMLAVVADGAGGHAGGERASRAAVESLQETWQKTMAQGLPRARAEEVLREAILTAHQEVINRAGGNAKFSGKCAIVAIYLCNGTYTVANVGDCRAYLAHKNTWKQLTIDDSLLRILVERGEVSPEEARNHPDQSRLTQALGTTGKVKPHISSGFYGAADRFLLCCDGLWNQLPEQLWDMKSWCANTPAEHSKLLLEMAQQAVQAAEGKSDNVSAIWLHTLPPPGFRLRKQHYILASAALLLCLAGGTTAYYYYVQKHHEETRIARQIEDTTKQFAAQLTALHTALLEAEKQLPEAANKVAAGTPLAEQTEMLQLLDTLQKNAAELKATAANLPEKNRKKICATLPDKPEALHTGLCTFCNDTTITAEKVTREHILALLGWQEILDAAQKAKEEADRKAEADKKAQEEAEREKQAQDAQRKAQEDANRLKEKEEADRLKKEKEEAMHIEAIRMMIDDMRNSIPATDSGIQAAAADVKAGKSINGNRQLRNKLKQTILNLTKLCEEIRDFAPLDKRAAACEGYPEAIKNALLEPQLTREHILAMLCAKDITAPVDEKSPAGKEPETNEQEKAKQAAADELAKAGIPSEKYNDALLASYNSPDRLKLLITAGADVNYTNQSGLTVLHWVAGSDNTESMKFLLTVPGIDINRQDMEGKTPLYWAASNGRHENVKLLLAAPGIDVKKADKEGKTPLAIAEEQKHHQCIDLLRKAADDSLKPAAQNPQQKAPMLNEQMPSLHAVCNNPEELKKLLAAGTDVNAADKDGTTPLIAAVNLRQVECCKLLLAAPGIDVNKADKDGTTPLISAVNLRQVECCKLLLAAPGIDVNKADNKGRTPLNWAACWDAELVKLLLAAPGIDINKADNEGKTPLKVAEQHNPDCVELIRKAGGK